MANPKRKILKTSGGEVTKYMNRESFCSDAEGTKWCEPEFYNEFIVPIQNTDEVYIIKNEDDSKFLLLRYSDEVTDAGNVVSDKDGSFLNPADFLHSNEALFYYPVDNDKKEEVFDFFTKRPDFLNYNLKRFLLGGASDEIFDRTEFVDYVNEKEPRNKSTLVLNFETDEEFLIEILELYDWDLNMMDCALNPDLECYINAEELSGVYESFSDGNFTLGYIFQGNPRLLEVANTIYKIINGGKPVVSDDEVKSANQILIGSFRNSIENILNYFARYEDEASFKNMRRRILEELAKFQKNTGIRFRPLDRTLEIPMVPLYLFMQMQNLTHASMKEVLSKYLLKNNQWNLSGWEEDKYNFFDDEFMDYDSLGVETEDDLNYILEKLQSSNFSDRKSFLNFLASLKSSWGYPENPHTKENFSVLSYDIDDDIVEFRVTNGPNWGKIVKMSREDFLNWYNNPRFNFESKNILLSLQQILEDASRKNSTPKRGTIGSHSNS
jgi:hypothetical protein